MDKMLPPTTLSVGMKLYDNSWFLKHQLKPEKAADVLEAMGVTWVSSS